ncbi:class I SAM-dependent methyltransferase [Falsiroseomonas sp.]|uniref:class I SAM-dependent methyltransferase n=1 Tax=Falsiroseomonas sp. TaxID=2870721 RepID=UPI0027376F05|nr:class I SAM-dependent methyltransferase [Falsiroseomonas sp.]MDP3419210.1 class I SAM-dependent methyltransferase [Falsiroseomonas sp.]
MSSAADQPIDVRRLIAEVPLAEHARRADASHDDLTPEHWSFRKPFAPLDKAGPNLMRLGAMLEAADLSPGLRVLEFGCGVAWLGRELAQAGCRVVATDIAPKALAAAAAHDARYHPDLAGKLRYAPYDGIRLAVANASQDRILCHEAFHHVPDQAAVLAEFARVLAPDGSAIFMEPGPRHSGASSSQAEMRRHGVIENDIQVQAIWDAAQAQGFVRMEVGLFTVRPRMLPVAEFQALYMHEFERGPPPPHPAADTYRALARPVLEGFRMFVLHRGATPAAAAGPDSRQREGLLARIQVLSLRRDATGLDLSLRVENQGSAGWLPSGAQRGAVNLGLLLLKPDGTLANRNWHRHQFLKAPLPPGAAVETRLRIALPEGAALSLDLVAEHVRWFGEPGLGQRLTLPG